MYKRYQVLLTDWQGEYIRYISKTYDLSFSETTRMLLCVAMIQSVRELCPKFKTTLTVKSVVEEIGRIRTSKAREEKLHSLLSKIYFEARKAVEVRLSEVTNR